MSNLSLIYRKKAAVSWSRKQRDGCRKFRHFGPGKGGSARNGSGFSSAAAGPSLELFFSMNSKSNLFALGRLGRTFIYCSIVLQGLLSAGSARADWLYSLEKTESVVAQDGSVSIVDELHPSLSDAGTVLVELKGTYKFEGSELYPKDMPALVRVPPSFTETLSNAKLLGVPVYLARITEKNLVGIERVSWVFNIERMKTETDAKLKKLVADSSALLKPRENSEKAARTPAGIGGKIEYVEPTGQPVGSSWTGQTPSAGSNTLK